MHIRGQARNEMIYQSIIVVTSVSSCRLLFRTIVSVRAAISLV
jgi:hypothetical protein